MDRYSDTQQATDYLYPSIEPFDQRFLDVGDGHRIYVEQSGTPNGIPVCVLHGGPGGGSSPLMRRFFDPQVYRIILFDQRGCGRSRPYASVVANTTWHLIADIEIIRRTLDISQMVLFGGSWGATLALTYALTHPQRVAHLVLRGVFLMTQRELRWFYAGKAGQFFPEAWHDFQKLIPQDERHDLIEAYHKRLFSGNMVLEMHYARAWALWENRLASFHDNHSDSIPQRYAHAFSRLENHYFYNKGFLECDGWILKQRHRLFDIPAHIVQGRYDMICPPLSAYKLAQGWEKASLEIIPFAGHAMSEPGISSTLIRIMNELRNGA